MRQHRTRPDHTRAGCSQMRLRVFNTAPSRVSIAVRGPTTQIAHQYTKHIAGAYESDRRIAWLSRPALREFMPHLKAWTRWARHNMRLARRATKTSRMTFAGNVILGNGTWSARPCGYFISLSECPSEAGAAACLLTSDMFAQSRPHAEAEAA